MYNDRTAEPNVDSNQKGSNSNNLISVTMSPRNMAPKRSSIKIGLVNCQSLCNKSDEIADCVRDMDFDALVVTETWLTGNDSDQTIIGDITPEGYVFRHSARSNRKGGGVGIILRNSLKFQRRPPLKVKSFENYQLTISSGGINIRVVIVYRLHPTKKNGIKSSDFFTEFAEFVDSIATSNDHLLILGDFNIHWDVPSNPDTRHLSDILRSANLTQHVNERTQIHGHILDLVISRETDDLVKNVCVSSMISDHYLVDIVLSLQKPVLPIKNMKYRKYRSIDKASFTADLNASRLISHPPEDLEKLVDAYNDDLRNIMDKHAPIKERQLVDRPPVPWYNKDIQAAKRHRRYCERLWTRTKLTVHHDIFKAARLLVRNRLSTAKAQYYNNKIKNCNGNQKAVFHVVNKVLHRNKPLLPTIYDSDVKMALEFNNYFQDKIQKIRDGLSSEIQYTPPTEPTCTSVMSRFEPLSRKEVKELLSKSSNAFCDLDPIPTWLMKECQHVLIAPVTDIVNLSLSKGVFPASMKAAIVKPLIKNHGLDCNILKNYRPVSNVSFLSKIIERAVSLRLNSYLAEHNLNESLQSAYKCHHSTETALVRVKNDIMMAVDGKKAVVLVLLDLSAAFDTVDHDVLFSRLENMFGLTSTVIDWFRSYFQCRSQTVSVGTAISEVLFMLFGVPQGSVLGPLIFIMYTRPIGIIARKYGVKFHLYADDTQLYASLDLNDRDSSKSSLNNLEQCIDELRSWMTHNRLKLNDDKSDVIYIASPHYLKSLSTPGIKVGDARIPPSDKVKNLGVIFDKYLNMESHITTVCRSAYFHLKNIRSLKPILQPEALITVTHAFITSRIDYCNSLLFGISQYNLNRLQRIQNCAARIITGTKKYDHITPALQKLHWLPVKQRIYFKILLLTYKAIITEAPDYICELIKIKTSTRSLRSGEDILLELPVSHLKTFGDSSFSVAGPRLWNQLPVEIRQVSSLAHFKTLLKSHLFRVAYNL